MGPILTQECRPHFSCAAPLISFMTSLPEITCLFAKLASSLRRPEASSTNDGEAATALASLVASLNSDRSEPMPRVAVLDAALSLGCFTTQEVCRARIECLVGTIVSVLSSSASCKILRLRGGNEEVLTVGSCVSFGDRDELLRICADVLESLEGHGGFSGLHHTLLYAALKAAVSSSQYQGVFALSSIFHEGNEEASVDRTNAVSRLTRFLPEESSVSNHEVPLKLLLWYLHPLSLKHDIAGILEETIQRPLLYLKNELHNRSTWRLIIICLVTSPTIFMEARALLHSWFLLTGLASALDLQIALVSSAIDLLSRPMRWGVPMEFGLKFPFLCAYFSSEHRELLSILSGSISCESFLDLVHHVRIAFPSRCSDRIFRHKPLANAADHNSTWAILMNFPAWFYFASALIFYQKNIEASYLSKVISDTVKTKAINGEELHKAAVEYVTWVLGPNDEAHHGLLTDVIKENSRSWAMKSRANCSYRQHSYSDTCNKNKVPCSKKLHMPKVNDHENPFSAIVDDVSLGLVAWLNEFRDHCVIFYSGNTMSHVSAEAKAKQVAILMRKSLLLKIPLGMLVLYPNLLDDKGCELLLHYAATGEIPLSEDIRKNRDFLGHGDFTSWFGGQGRGQALDGACLVFNLFDMIEDVFPSFECKDMKINFLGQMKGKVNRYLLRCVTTLLELHTDVVQSNEFQGADNLFDLYRRLIKWRKHGRDVFEGCKALNDVLADFARRFTFTFELDKDG